MKQNFIQDGQEEYDMLNVVVMVTFKVFVATLELLIQLAPELI